jgi:2-polyprenyl-6-hydroxyphenyl methylase/3-demethylubiquinone-9 3-methyltransferase
LSRFGGFDIVYSWGVLHHTGDMWRGLDNIVPLAKNKGTLYVALYNHQVYWSAFNTLLKRSYNRSPLLGKWIMIGIFASFQVVKGAFKDILFFRNPLHRYAKQKKSRGMSMWYDWLGGYPFEVSKPEEIVSFFHQKDFTLQKLKTSGGGHGCNEYAFIKSLTRQPVDAKSLLSEH